MKNNKRDFISEEDKQQAEMMLDFFKTLKQIINEDDDEPKHKGVTPRVNKQTAENIKRLGGQLIYECLQEEPNLSKIGKIEWLLGDEMVDGGYIDPDRDMPEDASNKAVDYLSRLPKNERAVPIAINKFLIVMADAYKVKMDAKYEDY